MEEKNFISKATDEESGSQVSDLDTNKTLFIDQYTTDVQSEDPVLLENAKTIGDVFKEFEPKVEVNFTDEDGGVVTETLHFNEIKDFEANGGKGNLVSNSEFLSKKKAEMDSVSKVRKQIKENKKLRDILKDPTSKAELKEYLQSLLNELEENE
jgi:predicted component of type VI protein secretion system